MAVFTAIGAYVATSIFGLAAGGLAAAVVGGIVATGAAMLTSRLINGSPGGAGGGGGGAAEQGTRVQLQPNPENKIPVLYGEAYCNGIVTDAWLDNSNKTMTYVLILSETCNNTGAVYSVMSNSNGPEIYYNDLRLDFDPSNQAKAIRGKKVVNGPGEDHTDDNFAIDGGRVFINIYAGNSSRRIWGNTPNAYDIQYLADHWDSNRRMEGLIFAVVQINYNSEKGFTGLPQMTFKLKNTVDNPADVLKDYLESNRYGAGIAESDIDTASLNLLRNISNEDVSYTPVSGGAAVTQKRYRVNGLIDTSRSCMDNIETIILNCGSWLSYDVSQGKWRVIPKRELSGTTWSGAPAKTGAVTSQPAPNWIFDDNNIMSGINISSTRLDNLFNAADIDFYDRNNKDQRGYVKLDYAVTRPELLNYNEPSNSLSLTFDLTNNNVQAERLANLELKQSRDDLVITFTTSHYGLQAQAGDVIGVRNDLYGWNGVKYPNGKYFRVLKTVEKEVNGHSLVNEISAIEYNADVYADESISEFSTSGNIGIAPRESSGTVRPPDNDGVTVESNPYDPVPNIIVNVTIPTVGGPYDEIQVYVAEETIGVFPVLTKYNLQTSHYPSPPASTFNPGTEQSITITTLPSNAAGKQYYIRVRLGILGIYGDFSDPDLAGLPPVTGNYDPSAGSTVAAAGGNLGNIQVGVDPNRNTITTVTGSLVLDAFDNNLAINTNMVYFQNNSTANQRGILGTVGNNDQWYVGGFTINGTSDQGAMVIASGNNGTEPIFARQYTGGQTSGPININSTIANEVTLLDANGNSIFPKNVTVGLDLAVNGGGIGNTADITSTATQANIFNAGVADINIGNDAGAVRLGTNSATGEVLIKPQNLVGQRNIQNVFNTVAETVNAFGAATTVNIGAFAGMTTVRNDLTVQGGNITLIGDAVAAQQPFITFQTQPDGVNAQYGIRGYSTVDDPWFIGAGSTGDDQGYIEIATGDNIGGTNNGGQIYVRQYNGAAPLTSVPWYGGNGTIVNQLTLLDNLGHTVIPNNLTVDTNTLFVDSVTNRVGIKTLTPGVELTVIGDTSLSNNLNVNGNLLFVNADADRVGINTGAPDRTLHVVGTSRITGDAIFGSNVEIQGQNLTTTQSTFNLLNSTATTVNAFGAATIVNMGSAAGIVNFANNIKVTGVINPFDDLVIGKNLIITENLRINGNQIKDSANVTRIQFNPPSQPATVLLDANATVTGDLRLNGNVIRASDGQLRITFDEPSTLINRTIINGRAEVTENLNVVGVLTAGTLNLSTTSLDVGSITTDALNVVGDGINPALIRALRVENRFRLNNINHTAALSSGSVIDPKLAPVVRFVNTASTSFTLSAGAEEQTFIMMNTTTAVNTFTVANAGWKSSGTGTLVLNAIGSTVNMTYQEGKWYVIGSNNATIS